jgi:trehalose 6-phosphate phosphatase
MLPAPFLPPPPDLPLGVVTLFLDFDGTLVPIAPRPDEVVVSDRVRALVACLADRLDGRLALVSGRSLAQIRALFEGLTFAVAGSHGLELALGNGIVVAPPPPPLGPVVAEAETFASRRPGVLVEAKPYGVAIHYREAPDEGAACGELAQRLAAASGLEIQPGKMVFELRAPGADKGAAVRRLMQHPPMAAGSPVFLGDALTDAAGFAAALDLGGSGILVGRPRPTAARFGLPGVEEALAWLEARSGCA